MGVPVTVSLDQIVRGNVPDCPQCHSTRVTGSVALEMACQVLAMRCWGCGYFAQMQRRRPTPMPKGPSNA